LKANKLLGDMVDEEGRQKAILPTARKRNRKEPEIVPLKNAL